MKSIRYVFPNISRGKKLVSPRGGLEERWQLATEFGCDFIEIPADLIKKTEEKTGLVCGAFLTKKAIESLYKKDSALSKDLKYIFHSDPELEAHHKLQWDNRQWRQEMAHMLVALSDYLGKPPAIIEIHPGTGMTNPLTHLAEGIACILDTFRKSSSAEPLVLIENRRGKQISRARDLRSFWKFLDDRHKELKRHTGIVLDFHQLHGQTNDDLHRKIGNVLPETVAEGFKQDLDLIPIDALKAFHVHGNCRYAHQIPIETDAIPWVAAFKKIKVTSGDLIINPEVLSKSFVQPTIDFCKKMLMLP